MRFASENKNVQTVNMQLQEMNPTFRVKYILFLYKKYHAKVKKKIKNMFFDTSYF